MNHLSLQPDCSFFAPFTEYSKEKYKIRASFTSLITQVANGIFLGCAFLFSDEDFILNQADVPLKEFVAGRLKFNGKYVEHRLMYISLSALMRLVSVGAEVTEESFRMSLKDERAKMDERQDWWNQIPSLCRRDLCPDSLKCLFTSLYKAVQECGSIITVTGDSPYDAVYNGFVISDILSDSRSLGNRTIKVVHPGLSNGSVVRNGPIVYERGNVDINELPVDVCYGGDCLCWSCYYVRYFNMWVGLTVRGLSHFYSVLAFKGKHDNSYLGGVSLDYGSSIGVLTHLYFTDLKKSDIYDGRDRVPVTVLQGMLGEHPGSKADIISSDRDIVSLIRAPKSVDEDTRLKTRCLVGNDDIVGDYDEFRLVIDAPLMKGVRFKTVPNEIHLRQDLEPGFVNPFPFVALERLSEPYGIYVVYKCIKPRPRGRIKIEKSMFDLMDRGVTVVGMTFVKQNGIFLRTKDRRKDEYRYDIFKGRVNFGENNMDALHREVREEAKSIIGSFIVLGRVEYFEIKSLDYGGKDVNFIIYMLEVNGSIFPRLANMGKFENTCPMRTRPFVRRLFDRDKWSRVPLRTIEFGLKPGECG